PLSSPEGEPTSVRRSLDTIQKLSTTRELHGTSGIFVLRSPSRYLPLATVTFQCYLWVSVFETQKA
ncbi:hypothetical protein ACTXT7_015305, partial [Hymenolepis weldensis]